MSKEIRTAHIQYDFENVIKDKGQGAISDDTFFINVDKSQDEVQEYTIRLLEEENSFNVGGGNQFKKIGSNKYGAVLDGEAFNFKTIIKDWTAERSNSNWTTLDISEEPKLRYVLGDSEGNISLFNGNFQIEREYEHAHASDITSVKFFPSGQVILSSSSDMQLKILSVEDGSNPRTFIGHTSTVTDTAIIGRGRNVLSSSKDGTVRLWECGSGSNIHTFARKENPSDGINELSLISEKNLLENYTANERLEFETEGKNVLAAHNSGVITLFDIFSKTQQLQLPSEFMSPCNCITTNRAYPNYVYSGYENGKIATWDLRFPEKSLSNVTVKNETPINSILYESNNIIISTGIDTSLAMKLDETSKELDTSCPSFLVSDDIHVSQIATYTQINGVQNLVAVGKFGFCAEYAL